MQKPPGAVACAATEIPGNLRSTYATRPHLSFSFSHCPPFSPCSHLSDLFFLIVLLSVALNLSLCAPLFLSYRTLWDAQQPNSTPRTFPQNTPFTSSPYLRAGFLQGTASPHPIGEKLDTYSVSKQSLQQVCPQTSHFQLSLSTNSFTSISNFYSLDAQAITSQHFG